MDVNITIKDIAKLLEQGSLVVKAEDIFGQEHFITLAFKEVNDDERSRMV